MILNSLILLLKNLNSLLIYLDKHVFYNDVYAFTNKFKDMTIIKENNKLKTIIFQCFRKSVLMQHLNELIDLKKMLRKASLTM